MNSFEAVQEEVLWGWIHQGNGHSPTFADGNK